MELTETKYKQTEVGLIPKDWDIKLIENVCDVIDPHPSHRAPAKSNYGIPFLGIGDFDERGNIITTTPRIVDVSILEEHKNRYDLSEGLIGLGRVASIGKVVSLRNDIGDYTISPTLGILRSKAIDSNYLKHVLNSSYIKNYFNKIMSGSTRSSVGMIVLRRVPIPLPKENEQKAIAQVLSDTDALIQALEKKIAKKKLIKKGVMQKLLTPKEGWVEKTLGEVGDIITGSTPSTSIEDYWNGDIPWITPTDINQEKDIFTSEREITQEGLYVTRKLPKDTLLVTCIASIGKNAILRNPGACNQQINAIIPNKINDVDFLYYLVEKNSSLIKNKAGITATLMISKKDFSDIILFFPKSLNEQRKIGRVLTDIDEEINVLKQKLSKYQLAKQGMMQQLLTGKIRLV